MTMKSAEQAGKVADGTASANGSEATVHSEATIDQVRNLLFGGAQRSIENNLAGLREEMQASLEQLQADFAKEIAALQTRLQELERDTEQKRLASHRDIGAAISELGASITRLGSAAGR
ncbi:hypothetical protein [Mesorhizobium sp.]|uniref:hypothetical protein n=1 Tax=Mesorhizobium sp. TaxID=1871066 RepID=UPI000FE9E071|nr:hypothetical protein [Mesorhizobium sp.]RWK12189.1 MAG: hypothetical protein EOR39_05255 [Mesorhizobium sp.]